jgi:hypothetical protein
VSNLIVSLNNPQNWIRLFTGEYEVTPIADGRRYVPIPSRLLPIQTDERILAVKAESTTALQNWQTGGWLIPTLDLSAAEFREARWGQFKIPLRYAGLVLLPDLNVSYRLRLDIPKWIKDVRVDVWQYLGPIEDSTENLIRQLATGLDITL